MSLVEETEVETLFPVWNRLSSSERGHMVSATAHRAFSAGAHIHSGGNDCIGVLLVQKGTLRAYMLSEEGREITLFRMDAGEPCVLSASCILSLITFDIFVDAETDVELLVVSSPFYQTLMEANPFVEAYTYRQTAERFSDVMWVMQQVLFMSFDRRLATFLVDESVRGRSLQVALTHDQIARHLGSAREVVSRMLKYFEHDGLVTLSRGVTTLVDVSALRRLATRG